MPKYAIYRTNRFSKALKKLVKSGNFQLAKLEAVVTELEHGRPLHPKYKDHQLTGELNRYRECHIENDLLLMYEVDQGILVLTLFRIGSHSQLFG